MSTLFLTQSGDDDDDNDKDDKDGDSDDDDNDDKDDKDGDSDDDDDNDDKDDKDGDNDDDDDEDEDEDDGDDDDDDEDEDDDAMSEKHSTSLKTSAVLQCFPTPLESLDFSRSFSRTSPWIGDPHTLYTFGVEDFHSGLEGGGVEHVMTLQICIETSLCSTQYTHIRTCSSV